MKYIMPRVIKGNRGDLASRWGVIKVLEKLNINDVTIFYQEINDLPVTNYTKIRYGYLKNIIPNLAGAQSILDADINLWAVGLDIQDDSSLTKLLYLYVLFTIFKSLNIKNIVLFQGAGPITTKAGRFFARIALKPVDIFIARDPGTYRLIDGIAPNIEKYLAHDAIFLPGFEEYCKPPDTYRTVNFRDQSMELVIGINIRLWFHFSSSIIPYQFNKRAYKQKSKPMMGILINRYCEIITWLIKEYNAQIVLISAYQSGVEVWEDDIYYLEKIYENFKNNPKVSLMEETRSLDSYFQTMSSLDLLIGMRLHSSLIALRFGVPSINISYTLKGKDIMEHIGLKGNVIKIEEFIESSTTLKNRVTGIIHHLEEEREKVNTCVKQAIKVNTTILDSIFNSGFD